MHGMSISTPFIQRPVATTLLTVAIDAGGRRSLIRCCPSRRCRRWISPPSSSARGLPGASPEVMAASVATPLEKQFTRIAGVTEMTSRSSVGSANVTLQFDLSRDINAAARDVQAAINAAAGISAGQSAHQSRATAKSIPADPPILILDADVGRGAAAAVVRHRLLGLRAEAVAGQRRRPGQVGGSSLPAVRVEVNPQPVSRLQRGSRSDRHASCRAPTPTSRRARSSNGRHRHAALHHRPALQGEGIQGSDRGLPQRRAGAPVGSRPRHRRQRRCPQPGLVNGKPAVLIQISRQPNANIIDTVDRIKALMPQFQAHAAAHRQLKIDTDRTTTIRASVHDAQRNMIISIALVILVVFLFLRNGWATFIPSVSVPVSLIATFGVMYLFGYTLDNLSLMALTIATGFVVDDAIVVIENITRHIEDGMTPMQAALQGRARRSVSPCSP